MVEYIEEDAMHENNSKLFDLEDVEVEQKYNTRGECMNCIRLISKGLSTDFCLEHYGTPRCVDD